VLDKIDYLFTGKEVDAETGWYNFGARYLNPTTGLWLSADPALGDYIPTGDSENDKNLPGMGGVFNPVNFALYHFAGNNPIRYTDPDGREDAVSTALTLAKTNPAATTAVVAVIVATAPVVATMAAAMVLGGLIMGVLGGTGDSVSRPAPASTPLESRGGANWLPEKGKPGSIIFNPPGTAGRKFDAEGNPIQDWNAPHPGEAGVEGRDPHVHDWKPRPPEAKVPGKGERQGARLPTPAEEKEWEAAKGKQNSTPPPTQPPADDTK
jgi:RHS repeat-associated protein